MVKTVLTIAGSDCSGGAGIQADIKTITAHKMYAMSVVTALTAQNTTGVYGVMDTPPSFVSQQLDCIFTDIFPDAVKIGMVSNSEIIRVIALKLKEYDAKNVVIDPVMISTSGSRLLSEDACEALVSDLFPTGTLITPNIPEAETLCGLDIAGKDGMLIAAKQISASLNSALLIKGGHLEGAASDLLYDNGTAHWYESPRVDSSSTHGTGCTLSSAIACNLAAGETLAQSIANAKEYLTGALKVKLELGQGAGPLDHMYLL